MNYENLLVRKGWQCPICGHVWNPSIPGCLTCNQEHKASTGDTRKRIDLSSDDPNVVKPTTTAGNVFGGISHRVTWKDLFPSISTESVSSTDWKTLCERQGITITPF